MEDVGLCKIAPWGLVLLLFPVASGQSDRYVPETEAYTVEPGRHLRFELDRTGGLSKFDFLIESDRPVDIILLRRDQYEAYRGTATSYYPTETFTNQNSLRHVFELPSVDQYVLVIDNSENPVGGAPGTTAVSLRAAYIPLTPTGTASGFGDFFRALFLRQSYWEVPLVTGVGIAGPTLIFFFVALACAGIAQINEEEKGYWWLSILALTLVGAAFTIVVPGVGFLLDTRWLTIPAAAYGYLTYKRTADTVVSACAVFSVAFFSSFVGVDVLTEIMHHGEHVEDFYYLGTIGIFGGAGWGDLLILAPVIGVATFFVWFRFGTSHTKLHVEASLQGDTHRGTLFLKVTNLGEQSAKTIRCGVWFQGHGLPDTVIEETVIAEELPAKHETTHSIKNPGKKVELRAAWDAIVVGAWADNAKMAGERIELAQG